MARARATRASYGRTSSTASSSRQRPYSPIDIAVRVQAPLNMGILSHRQSKVATFDKEKLQIVL